MKRKLFAIWSIIKCKNYLLTTFKDESLLHDHTMNNYEVICYSQMLIKHYTEIEVGCDNALIQAKDILGI